MREFPDRFRICGMVAGQNLILLAKQIKEFSPECVAIKHEQDVPRLRRLLGKNKAEILFGEAGAAAVASAPEVDVVLAAIVGGAGLMPCFKGLLAGKEIALANKEASGHGGRNFRRRGKEKRRPSSARRQRAQRDISMLAGQSTRAKSIRLY